MDTSNIIITHLDENLGIKIGQANAPVKVIEFINLRCPYCRKWFNDSKETYSDYIEAGKVQRTIKLFDKVKPGLDKGNIMHQFVPNTQDSKALEAIAAIYATQDQWGNLENFDDIATFAETELNLTRLDHHETADAIVAEAADATIIFVPTMIVGDEIFDQKISQADFKKVLDNA